jgi:hypothetical protein
LAAYVEKTLKWQWDPHVRLSKIKIKKKKNILAPVMP